MSSHVLLNIYYLRSLGKEITCKACKAFYHFFATRLINSIILLFVLMHYISAFF